MGSICIKKNLPAGAASTGGESAPFEYFKPILPSQLYEKDSYIELDAERTLMVEVMMDAIKCLKKAVRSRNGIKRSLYEKTKSWFLDDSEDWIFSFKNICNVLNLNADYLRRKVDEMEKEIMKNSSAYRKRWYRSPKGRIKSF